MKRMVTEKEVAEIASAVAIDEIEDATIESSQLSSGEATEGQVLTADGSGGVSWEDASGGDKLYQHSITCHLYSSNLMTDYGYTNIIVYTKSSTPFTAATFKSYLSTNHFDGSYERYIRSPLFGEQGGVIYTIAQISVLGSGFQCTARGYTITDGALTKQSQSSLVIHTGDAFFYDNVNEVA